MNSTSQFDFCFVFEDEFKYIATSLNFILKTCWRFYKKNGILFNEKQFQYFELFLQDATDRKEYVSYPTKY